MDRYLNNCTEDELVCMQETKFEMKEQKSSEHLLNLA